MEAIAYILMDYGILICFAFSFFVNRFITKPSTESYRQSALAGLSVAIVAAVDFALRISNHVATYAITYGALVASYVFSLTKAYVKRNGHTGQVAQYAPSVCSLGTGIVVSVIVHKGYVQQSIVPGVNGYVKTLAVQALLLQLFLVL